MVEEWGQTREGEWGGEMRVVVRVAYLVLLLLLLLLSLRLLLLLL